MDELAKKLKVSLVNKLLSNEQLINEPYLSVGNKKWTRKEIAEEIGNETVFGIKQMSILLMLSLDLLAREKV
jgi:hypothetical protein